MPTPHRPPPAARRALKKLGADIQYARKVRRLPLELVAERASTSRQTVARLERGEEGIGIGVLAAVLQALGLEGRLADLVDPKFDETGQVLTANTFPERVRTGTKR